MRRTPLNTPDAVPAGLIVVGSGLIAFHLIAVIFAALTAPSGPWPMMQGSDMVRPPQFAYSITTNYLMPYYLRFIKMPHHYHFATNRPGVPDTYMEVRLKDAAGETIGTLRYPEKTANPWIRHRQAQLAMGLAMDEMVAPPQSEVIPAPNQEPPKVTIWQPMKDPQTLHLETTPQHLIPRNGMVMRPSDLSMLFARSYARFLCRTHGAASAEIIRHHKDPIPAAILFMDNVQANNFDEVSSTFGDLPQ